MKQIQGENPPAITIFNESGGIDFEAMRCHADYLIENGVDGIAYLGTSGEFGVLTQAQKLELIREMAVYVNHRVNVLFGVGDTCMSNTKELIRAAEEAGGDGVLAVPPYFSIYSEVHVEAYYEELARSCTLPIIIYNFPELTGFDIKPELVGRLIRRHGNIVGIKDTVGDISHLRGMIELKRIRPDFSVFCAYESQALQMAAEGVDGFINATGNFAPEWAAGLCRAARENRQAEMEEFARKMGEASKVYDCSVPLFLAVKEAVYQCVLKKRGYEKLPGLPLSGEGRENVGRVLRQLALIE